jgi:hypothetical protein
MKKRSSNFCVTLALMTVATLLIAARSEPAKSNTDSSDVAANQTQPAAATEPAAAQLPKTNGMKKATQSARLSFGVDEVVKMYQSGVDTDVIVNYVENSSVPYHLNAEEIVHLHDIGVPSQITTTLIRHGAMVQQQANAASAVIQQKATEEAKAASANVDSYAPAAYAPPAPAVNYTYAYPTYVNTYPAYGYLGYYPSYYSYPRYCYSSPFYFRYGYSGYRNCYSYGSYGHYAHYGHGVSVGARFGHSPSVGIRARF